MQLAAGTHLGKSCRRLAPDVAIKVLPELFSSDPDRLARFQREAQLLASLSHPNIAIVYGVEEAPGIRALVMDLTEGSFSISLLITN